jgi:mannose-1-phosphate guanylyltransferase
MRNTYVLIMAGGVGSRFWPKSRNNFPKQFIDILGLGKSLLQLTYERFLKVCPAENIYVLTNERYISVIAEQLPALGNENIIAEPSRNNTAPCITYASFKIANLNPEAKIIIAPSDHLILDETTFLEKIRTALDFARRNEALVTLGITPTRPDTGYGYIKYNKQLGSDVHKVIKFLEKPNLEKAGEFVNSGDYLWNAGIFIWNVGSILNALKKYIPDLYALFFIGTECYNTSGEKDFITRNYPLSPKISIDYAIMEVADNVYTIPGDFGWSDLGTWASLYEVMDKDESNNVFSGFSASLPETENCMIQLPKEKVAIIKGLSNYIIVDDGKVLLIYPKQQEQEIKEVSKGVVALCGIEFS